MPMDSAAYEKKLNQLIADSKFEKKVVEIANEDFTKSFIDSTCTMQIVHVGRNVCGLLL